MHYAIPITQKLKKLVRSLNQKQHRDSNSLFLAEGEKLCRELLNSDFDTELVLIRDSSNPEVIDIANEFGNNGIPIYNAPKHQFDQLTETKSPQGIIAVANKKDRLITPNESFLALEDVQDPGNVGTIIRTAEWFGIKQILITPNCADQYNPKTVRATMGSIYRVDVIVVENISETIATNFSKVDTYSAIMNSTTLLSKVKPKSKFGLVFGNEGKGISKALQETIKNNFTIEGYGSSESLNVAVAVGISLNHFARGGK